VVIPSGARRVLTRDSGGSRICDGSIVTLGVAPFKVWCHSLLFITTRAQAYYANSDVHWFMGERALGEGIEQRESPWLPMNRLCHWGRLMGVVGSVLDNTAVGGDRHHSRGTHHRPCVSMTLTPLTTAAATLQRRSPAGVRADESDDKVAEPSTDETVDDEVDARVDRQTQVADDVHGAQSLQRKRNSLRRDSVKQHP